MSVKQVKSAPQVDSQPPALADSQQTHHESVPDIWNKPYPNQWFDQWSQLGMGHKISLRGHKKLSKIENKSNKNNISDAQRREGMG